MPRAKLKSVTILGFVAIFLVTVFFTGNSTTPRRPEAGSEASFMASRLRARQYLKRTHQEGAPTSETRTLWLKQVSENYVRNPRSGGDDAGTQSSRGEIPVDIVREAQKHKNSSLLDNSIISKWVFGDPSHEETDQHTIDGDLDRDVESEEEDITRPDDILAKKISDDKGTIVDGVGPLEMGESGIEKTDSQNKSINVTDVEKFIEVLENIRLLKGKNISSSQKEHVEQLRQLESREISDREIIFLARKLRSKVMNITQILRKPMTLNMSGIIADKTDAILENISLPNITFLDDRGLFDIDTFRIWSSQATADKATFRLPEFKIDGRRICADRNTELLILIPSTPEHLLTRQLIRQTWAGPLHGLHWPGRSLALKTKLMFLIGSEALEYYKKDALGDEADRHGDIVVSDFTDSYRNLTVKMISGLHWVVTHCSQAKFVLKVDEDTFVNLPLLTKFILKIAKKIPTFMLGHKHSHLLPPVVRRGKWAVSGRAYPLHFFPPYLFGHSYVLAAHIIPKLLDLAVRLPIIPAEDAHVTGILATIMDVPRIHYEGFADANKKLYSCSIVRNRDITMTRMTLSRRATLWTDVLTNTCSHHHQLSWLSDVIDKPKHKHTHTHSEDWVNIKPEDYVKKVLSEM